MKYLFSFLLCGLLFNCSLLSDIGHKKEADGEELSDQEKEQKQEYITSLYEIQSIVIPDNLRTRARTWLRDLDPDRLSITEGDSILHVEYDDKKLMRVEDAASEIKIHLFNESTQFILDNWDRVAKNIGAGKDIQYLNMNLKVRVNDNTVRIRYVNSNNEESDFMSIEKINREDGTKKVSMTINKAQFTNIRVT